MNTQQLFRSIPQVGDVLDHAALQAEAEVHGRAFVADTLRRVIDDLRRAIARGEINDPGMVTADALAAATSAALAEARRPNLCRVLNGTGVILHTSLGRAVLAEEAWRAAGEIAGGYSMLELDRASGKRGDRDRHVSDLLCELTGAEAATVVNNNAAATMLILNELAFGREAVISRAHMVEIGGSYRMPEVMKKSGARMVEVGATNKTRAADYEEAIGDNTGCIIKVHTSNYAIQGFTHFASIEELVEIGKRRGVPVVYDLGAGSLVDLAPFGLVDEPVVRDLVASGVDVVCFSGDKLLGGPQAGMCVGTAAIIERLKKNQMFRMLRCDKVTLALLEATLRLYRDPERVWERVPTLRMIAEPLAEVRKRAKRLAAKLAKIAGVSAAVENHEAYVGGGSLPTERIASAAAAVAVEGLSSDGLARALRLGEPSVFGRIRDDRLLLDCRTLADADLSEMERAFRAAAARE